MSVRRRAGPTRRLRVHSPAAADGRLARSRPTRTSPTRARSRARARASAHVARPGARAPRARRPGAPRARSSTAERVARRRARSRASTTRVALDPRATSSAARAITVHGDYDVDGVCSTAVLVRALRDARRRRRLVPAEPHRGRLRARRARPSSGSPRAARGCWSPSTAAITAVDEVALRARPGMDVVVTDHHRRAPTARCRTRRSCTRRSCGYPCPDLCATGVAYKLAQALLEARGRGPGRRRRDLDLVALATVADLVPLRGENRRLVRARAARARRHAQARACAR